MPTSMSKSLLRAVLVPFVATTLLLLGVPTAASAHTTSSGKVSAAQVRAQKVAKVLTIAQQQRGDRYRYGAAGPNAFDCSGLVQYATKKAGFKGVPRTSSAQSKYMKKISRSSMRPGDFVFFHRGGRVYHVGVYTGTDKAGKRVIVHAPGTGKKVRKERIWTGSWFPGTLRA